MKVKYLVPESIMKKVKPERTVARLKLLNSDSELKKRLNILDVIERLLKRKALNLQDVSKIIDELRLQHMLAKKKSTRPNAKPIAANDEVFHISNNSLSPNTSSARKTSTKNAQRRTEKRVVRKTTRRKRSASPSKPQVRNEIRIPDYDGDISENESNMDVEEYRGVKRQTSTDEQPRKKIRKAPAQNARREIRIPDYDDEFENEELVSNMDVEEYRGTKRNKKQTKISKKRRTNPLDETTTKPDAVASQMDYDDFRGTKRKHEEETMHGKKLKIDDEKEEADKEVPERKNSRKVIKKRPNKKAERNAWEVARKIKK